MILIDSDEQQSSLIGMNSETRHRKDNIVTDVIKKILPQSYY